MSEIPTRLCTCGCGSREFPDEMRWVGFVTTTERVYVCARAGCANRVYADGKFCGSHA